MRFEIKLTDKQCENIAEKIYNADFRLYGIGNFNVNFDEFVEIIRISFNEMYAEEKLKKYFKKISPM